MYFGRVSFKISRIVKSYYLFNLIQILVCRCPVPCFGLKWGRVDVTSCSKTEPALPSPKMTWAAMFTYFQTQFGFTNAQVCLWEKVKRFQSKPNQITMFDVFILVILIKYFTSKWNIGIYHLDFQLVKGMAIYPSLAEVAHTLRVWYLPHTNS